jgi:hypothetical protein
MTSSSGRHFLSNLSGCEEQMPTLELYHGAEGHKILYNIKNRSLTCDRQGKLYFAEREWRDCLVHGADSKLGESYVVKVWVQIPNGATLARHPTPGNRDARILQLAPGEEVRAEVLEMYVRSGKSGDFTTDVIPGAEVQRYLEQKIAAVEAKASK